MLVVPLLAQTPARTGMKLGDFNVHDPWILAHQESKTYYLYTSGTVAGRSGGNRSGVVAYKSKDLENWDGPQQIWVVPDGLWANPAHGAWAPEVHRYRGRYYLFVTLHNNDKLLAPPALAYRVIYGATGQQNEPAQHHMRGTQIFVGDSPEGPFQPMGNRPVAPVDYMTLDGTLYVENGVPWMVYAHEWIQVIDGTMEAIQLKPDLSEAVGEPFHMFKASDAPWLLDNQKVSKRPRSYVTDGPELYRTKTGHLIMLWSSYRDGLYVETMAYSTTGKLRGPWKQAEPLVGNDSGHGMLFNTLEGKLMLILHQPFRQAKGKLFEMEDTGDAVRVLRQIVF